MSSRTRKMVSTAVLVAAAMLALAACGDGEEETLGKTADIVIDNQGITPDRAEIKLGQEVVFSVLNNDTRPHTFTLPFIAVDEDNFIDETIAPGERIDVKIKATERPAAGFYSFYSKEHQAEGYQGQIIVTE